MSGLQRGDREPSCRGTHRDRRADARSRQRRDRRATRARYAGAREAVAARLDRGRDQPPVPRHGGVQHRRLRRPLHHATPLSRV